MKLNGNITLVRRTKGDGEDRVIFVVRADGIKAKVVEAELSLADFARALLGVAEVKAGLQIPTLEQK